MSTMFCTFYIYNNTSEMSEIRTSNMSNTAWDYFSLAASIFTEWPERVAAQIHLSHLLYPFSCLTSSRSHLLSHVSCLTSPRSSVSSLLTHVSCTGVLSPGPESIKKNRTIIELVLLSRVLPWRVDLYSTVWVVLSMERERGRVSRWPHMRTCAVVNLRFNPWLFTFVLYMCTVYKS